MALVVGVHVISGCEGGADCGAENTLVNPSMRDLLVAWNRHDEMTISIAITPVIAMQTITLVNDLHQLHLLGVLLLLGFELRL